MALDLLKIGIPVISSIAVMAQIPDGFLNELARDSVFAGLVGLFVWWSWARENRLAARIDGLEAFEKNELITMVRVSTEAVSSTKDVITDATRLLNELKVVIESDREETRKLVQILQTNPCLLFKDMDKSGLQQAVRAWLEGKEK